MIETLIVVIIIQGIVIGVLAGFISGRYLAKKAIYREEYRDTGVTTPEERGESPATGVDKEGRTYAPTEQEADFMQWAQEQGYTEQDEDGITPLGRLRKRFEGLTS